jgi:hypothetical protein
MGKPRNLAGKKIDRVGRRRGGGKLGENSGPQAAATRRANSRAENSGISLRAPSKTGAAQVPAQPERQKSRDTRNAQVGVKGPTGVGGRPTRSGLRIQGS